VSEGHREVVQQEFERVARTFADRTAGRFDRLGVVEFSQVDKGDTVLEVGVGTGNFLAIFADVARAVVGVDLTPGMLAAARDRYPEMLLVAGDGARLPLSNHSIGLATTAQTLHHIPNPVPVLVEMRRVVRSEGRVLVVDQVAPEDPAQAARMNELEKMRDPSHAESRPPSVLRRIVEVSGLEIVDERLVENRESLNRWMSPEEFPEERIRDVTAFLERQGGDTGMAFEKSGGDWIFTRVRMMLLASPARS
jgi:ubiquinone/menaquinone biosynthesis C-methylase UbiE